MRRHHQQSATAKDEQVEHFNAAPDIGLTKDQVAQRTQAGLTNTAINTTFKTTRQIIYSNTFTFFNLIFVVLAVLLVMVRSFKDMTFLPVIIVNTVIGIIQELRSKKVLEKLTVLNAAKATAIRDGKSVQLPTDQLVLDDIIELKTGQQIPADAQLLTGSLNVNESLLTGEADEIAKHPGDSLMSGSFVVSGLARVRLTHVGADSYAAKLTAKAQKMDTTEESAMIKSLNRLIKFVGIIIIPIGAALFYESYVHNGNTLKQSIVSMEAALIGMIPEGLYLLATVALALSAMKLAQQRVLLHSMKSIETLARVTVLCVDKTGTITENQMQVQRFFSAQQAQVDENRLRSLISDFCAAMPGDNSTMKAMKEYFTQGSGRQADQIVPFSSAWKYSGVGFGNESYVLGAPEMVLRESAAMFSSEFEPYAKQGFRVLVFGQYQGQLTKASLSAPVTPLGFILLRNPVRKTAPATFRYFAEQGVKIKVISGDDPLTVASVAKQAQIEGAQNCVSAATLADDEYEGALQRYTVFGRVTPDQKQKFVTALQKQGEVVAMTGDGVNDILAMKRADTSIAMASGNEATMNAAQMVLLDSDFAKMPQVVAQGRQVVNNIERSASLFLVKNIFSLLLSIFTLIFAFNYPLDPSHITLISLFTIGTPSFLLALETNHQRIHGKFLPNVMRRALPGGITDMFTVGVIVVCGALFGLSRQDISTASTMILAAVGFMVLYQICHPLNKFRSIIFYGCIMGLLVCALLFGSLFGIDHVSAVALGFAFVLSLTGDSSLTHLTRWTDLIYEHFFANLGQKPKHAMQKQA